MPVQQEFLPVSKSEEVEEPKIHICLSMIVKDHPDSFKRAILSAHGLYDSLSITLTDNYDPIIKEIAESFGAIISYYHSREGWPHRFIDNFAAARNVSLDHVPKEATHIFILDSDEMIVHAEELWLDIVRIAKQPGPHSIQVVHETTRKGDVNCSTILSTRCISNVPGVKWEGRIHNRIAYPQPFLIYRVSNFNIHRIRHDVSLHTDRKFRANILINEALQQEPKVPIYKWYKGRELMETGEYAGALRYYLHYMEYNQGAVPNFDIAFCYFQLDELRLSWKYLCKALRADHTVRDVYLLMGLCCLRRAEATDKLNDWLRANAFVVHYKLTPRSEHAWRDLESWSVKHAELAEESCRKAIERLKPRDV